MTPEQKAAYIISQSTSALIEALGMFSHDAKMRTPLPMPGQHSQSDYVELIERYGISHNMVISFIGGLTS